MAASDATTIREILGRGLDADPALMAPERQTLSFAGLRRQIDATVARLNGLGIGRNDRVAIVLPNGPEMAAAFVAVACGATTAPLNPAYRGRGVRFLSGRPQGPGADRPASGTTAPPSRPPGGTAPGSSRLRVAADRSGRRLHARGRGCRHRRRGEPGGPAEADDVGAGPAHLGHHLAAEDRAAAASEPRRPRPATSARRWRSTPADRCLNIMPLFHIHGLIAAVLSSLAAGASVFCTPGFNALRFFAWLDEARPTWYTAVPTMHQAILARAERNRRASRPRGCASSAPARPRCRRR